MNGFFNTIFLYVIVSLFSLGPGLQAQSNKRVCMHMKSQTMQKGQVLTTEADQYFLFPEGKIISFFESPEEYIFISNTLGEARIYRPRQNQVILQSNLE